MKLDEVLNLKNENNSSRGYKAMATSAGVKEWGKVKTYLKSKKVKKAMKDVEDRSKDKENPEAYKYSVERKIVKQHFNKNK